MDFECSMIGSYTDDDTLSARASLWLIRAIIEHQKLDFDVQLTNRLRLLSHIKAEVQFDINVLVEASVLTKSNQSHKQSLCSLLTWLYDYLDCRTSLLKSHKTYLETLVSKLLFQIKIYPTVLITAGYSNNTHTTFYASIKFSRLRSHRLTNLLDFDTLILNHQLTSGNIIRQ